MDFKRDEKVPKGRLRTVFNTLVGAMAGALATGLLALLAQYLH